VGSTAYPAWLNDRIERERRCERKSNNDEAKVGRFDRVQEVDVMELLYGDANERENKKCSPFVNTSNSISNRSYSAVWGSGKRRKGFTTEKLRVNKTDRGLSSLVIDPLHPKAGLRYLDTLLMEQCSLLQLY
jgi:hypothetical protein